MAYPRKPLLLAAASIPAAALLAAASMIAAADEPTELFGESLDVTVVNVDVYVTDKSGNRVQGLTRDDFELFEDKKPVQITNFYAVEAGRPENQQDPGGVAVPAVPGVLHAAAEIPDEQRLSLIVYVDNFNLRPFNRNRILRELRQFLAEKVRPGDRVMLVSYDRELHVRRGFTSDPLVIASALFELEKLSAQGTQADSARRDILEAIDEAEDVSAVHGRVRGYADSLFNDLQFTVSALRDLVEQTAGLPGRKAILYVSDGLPMRAAEDVFHALAFRFPQKTSLLEAQPYDASRRFSELANQANANRVSFYTLEATGLRVSAATDASQSNPGLGIEVEQIHFANLQSTLQMLADKTGGVAILNANQVLPQLERAADDFQSYYSLGYSPAHGGDGRYYRIEVKPKRKGLTVRHREGYRDKPVDSRMSDGVLANLRFGGDANSMGVNLEIGTTALRSDGLYSVQLTVRVPIGKVLLVPREALHEGRVTVYVAAMDEEGETSEVGNAPVAIRIPPDQVEENSKKYYAYSLTLVMRKGEQRVAVGVRDDLAGTTAFLSKSLRVGS